PDGHESHGRDFITRRRRNRRPASDPPPTPVKPGTLGGFPDPPAMGSARRSPSAPDASVSLAVLGRGGPVLTGGGLGAQHLAQLVAVGAGDVVVGSDAPVGYRRRLLRRRFVGHVLGVVSAQTPPDPVDDRLRRLLGAVQQVLCFARAP